MNGPADRSLAIGGLAVASTLLIACGGSSSSGASPTPNLSNYEGPGIHHEYVDVEPHDNLTDGQTVMVSGLGFKPNLELAFNICKLITRGYSDCDPTTTITKETRSNAQGSFPPTPYKVREHVAFPSDRNAPTDCGTDKCGVGVGDVGGLTAGSHCIGFGGPCQAYPGNKPLTTPPPASWVIAVPFAVLLGVRRVLRRRR